MALGKIMDSKTRCTFTLTTENVRWIDAWLKRNGAPRIIFSGMVDEYVAGIRQTLEALEKMENQPTIGDLFKLTGDALNKLKSPPLL